MYSLKQLIKSVPGFQFLDNFLRKRYTGFPDGERYNRGHFYSPLPDLNEVARSDHLFRKDVDLGESIDLRPDSQLESLKGFASYYGDFPWKERCTTGYRFHLQQSWFCHGDALILYSMLRHLRPKRVIEVGSGFSSALMLDTSDQFLDSSILFTFIDPYPDRLLSVLREDDAPLVTLHRLPVQEVPLECFKALEAKDILFIDSSHVSRIGSDLNFLLFEVLPVLKPGVVIHFHDIFWPFEYPREWVLTKRAWNESYALRAFLQFNSDFRVTFFNSFIEHAFRDEVDELMPFFLNDSGGSLWIERNQKTLGCS